MLGGGGVYRGGGRRKPNRESEKDRVTEEYVETTQHTHSLPHRLETEKKTTKKRVQQIFFHFLFRLRTKTQTQTQTDRNGLSALYFIHAIFLLVEFFAPLPFPSPFCSRSSVELHKIRTERGKKMRERDTQTEKRARRADKIKPVPVSAAPKKTDGQTSVPAQILFPPFPLP